MSVKDQVVQAIEHLSDTQLQQVIEYVDFLKFRAGRMPSSLDDAQLATLYAEFAQEDQALAEDGLADYNAGLQAEDVQ
jgi:hypothetical protein